MTTGTTSPARVSPDDLERFVGRIFVAAGLPEDDAKAAAAALVDADLGGVDSHGVMRVPVYVDRLGRGLINPRPEFDIDRSGSRILLDADNALGQVAAARAVDEVAGLASEMGVAAVLVRNSNHFGTAAYHARRLTERGAVAIVMTNAPPLMAPVGGAKRILGNNPICIAAPTRGEPAVIDISLTEVAGGKILAAGARGEKIPEGWATSTSGEPITDPAEAMSNGLLNPVGAHKGAGLAFMIDVLVGVLSGAGFGPGVKSIYGLGDDLNNAGHAIIALQVDRFMETDVYLERVEGLTEVVRGAPRLPGVDRIYIPGEPEVAIREERRQEGIAVPEKVLDSLDQLAKQLAVPGL